MTTAAPMPVLKPSLTPGFRCLILEDDPSVARILAEALNTAQGESVIAGTIDRAKTLMADQQFDVCLLDYLLPDGKGSSFYSYFREQGGTAPCIMLTAAPEIPVAVELTRSGLFDYLTKPIALRRLLECVQRAAAFSAASQTSLHGFGLVDSSRAMRTVRRLVYQAAANPQTTVLITGETGVGKDLVARLIHQLSFQNVESSPRWCP